MGHGHMTIEATAEALRQLADELDATHAPPFTGCFLDEHWQVIEQVLDRMVNGAAPDE